MWHLLIEELDIEDDVTISHEARAVGSCATCCTKAVTLCSGQVVEALGERLDRDAARYHGEKQATVVFLALHVVEA